ESVRFDDQRQTLRPEIGGVEIGGRGSGETCAWDVMPPQEILGEGLRTFEARGVARGAEAAPIGGCEAIDDTGDQRRLGTDDCQVDILVDRRPKQCFDIVCRDVEIADVGFERVAGRRRRLSEFSWRYD